MDSASTKNALMQQVQQEANVANVRTLIERLQKTCFEKCVPKPGASISSGEESCVKMCIEKYMTAWNDTNAAYITRIKQEAEKGGFS